MLLLSMLPNYGATILIRGNTTKGLTNGKSELRLEVGIGGLSMIWNGLNPYWQIRRSVEAFDKSFLFKENRYNQ